MKAIMTTKNALRSILINPASFEKISTVTARRMVRTRVADKGHSSVLMVRDPLDLNYSFPL